MGIQQSQQPLKVYLSDISPHSQAILEFFIGSTGGKSFKLVSTPVEAEVYITDFDYPGSKEHWEAEHETSAKPCIALSIKDPENQYVKWVAKPITAAALIAAAATIADSITKNEGSVAPSSKPETTQLPPSLPALKSGQSPFRQKAKTDQPAIHTRAPLFQQSSNKPSIVKTAVPNKKNTDIKVTNKVEPKTPAIPKKQDIGDSSDTTKKSIPSSKRRVERPHATQERWDILCGDAKEKSAHRFIENENFRYNTESYFQGTLIAGLRLAKQTKQVVQIKYAPHQFYVCYDEYLIFSPLAPDSDEYATLCNTKVKPGQVNLHILTSPESADIRDKVNSDINFTYDLESFIWTSCLLTSKGRIPTSLDHDTQYLLKYWPNFTRIENIPFAMKLAARWQKKPYKITEIANEMNIPLRYVAAFVNGVVGLSLFETDTSIVQQKASKKPAKKNGLIARLFGRLTRSEATS